MFRQISFAAGQTPYPSKSLHRGKGLVKLVTRFCSEFATKNRGKHAQSYFIIHLVNTRQHFNWRYSGLEIVMDKLCCLCTET